MQADGGDADQVASYRGIRRLGFAKNGATQPTLTRFGGLAARRRNPPNRAVAIGHSAWRPLPLLPSAYDLKLRRAKNLFNICLRLLMLR
ncbi:hypothetical protein D3879_04975 [Pseudomonas cavernicola]|uniref:Uncharacterized protein n=1 Tax=Pseudomonas cavernicola TaxID=2320866 RepID=A0A418XJI6_9PSED|nr:hypothetical protein D3879_04975 [Pseudomonas cavernicola]